ncbi:peroxisomal membrane anchor protein conserved region-domain-containing protein [Fimicolochytrium jonesii]|uniref:peroxisomal membrane anchor protein conserved region-domain-containing protein n=1 Tax=Fimicolochytrium jonesii TaxID=1396493 RepID=UPI0022FEABE0|nr:peroxisomal membrane anchor protein conserved region-domain-containing protein [Fimicolochytrium jonesii]KAI8825006.1 peroxisomal membrane anchor protein conserved region-domain-containing protein [Fimicolochytrium jonesii]
MVKAGVREDIVQSAVRFLRDPKVQESPLAKRVSFLETKGLSADEIEEALSRASASGPAASVGGAVQQVQGLPPQATGAYQQYAPIPYPQYPPPPPPGYNWKDYTLGAIGAVGAGYGLWTLLRKHVIPHLQFPTPTAMDDSNTELSTHLANTTTVMESVKAETMEVMKAVDAQGSKVNEALQGMVATLTLLRESDENRDREMLELKRDVDGIRDLIPKMLDKSKESQTAVITDLQNEIKSLKSLLLNRRVPNTPPASNTSSPNLANDAVASPTPAHSQSPSQPSQNGSQKPDQPTVQFPTPAAEINSSVRTSFPNIPRTPTIPAWQLAGTGSSTSTFDAKPVNGSSAKDANVESADRETPASASTSSDDKYT